MIVIKKKDDGEEQLQLQMANGLWGHPRASDSPGMCSGSEAGSYIRIIDFVYH